MICPNCKNTLTEEIKIKDMCIVKCEECEGMWFEGGELQKSKDEMAPYATWFDFDLWKDESQFHVSKSSKVCPKDQTSLFTLKYGSSDVEIDACKECNGIWLDAGEFEKIITYVESESDLELIRNYTKVLLEEGKEIVTGPESLPSEIVDFLLVVKMFQYKFMAQHPILTKIIMTRIPTFTA